jgi:PiT family inorganic phosphate transporter
VQTLGLVAVIAVALGFAYTNGFHDAAYSVATSVATRALTPRIALIMAAALNFAGAYIGVRLGDQVTKAIVKGIIVAPPQGTRGLVVVFAALAGAIVWNLITWYYGLPSSSSHALIGGLVGAGLGAGLTVHWGGVWGKVVLPLLLSPLVGFLLAFGLMVGILWAVHRRPSGPVIRWFHITQPVSAAGMALGHGIQDAQKTMGVMMLALIAAGHATGDSAVPWWVLLLSASALSLGTYAGGWRIMRTLGRRIATLDPPRGFTAETAAALVLYFTTFIYAAPISTTQVITGTVAGAGAVGGRREVRWGTVRTVAFAWLLTLPAAGVCGAAAYYGADAIVG